MAGDPHGHHDIFRLVVDASVCIAQYLAATATCN